eukprot:ctg_5344.g538
MDREVDRVGGGHAYTARRGGGADAPGTPVPSPWARISRRALLPQT